MNSKTPEFEKALERYFTELELDEKGGQERNCRFSGKKFYIKPEDIKFYRKIRVPLPTLSPHERTRRRLSFYNLYHLFYAKSAKTGDDIISAYPEDTPYKIYEHTIWKDSNLLVDEEYNLKKSFFEQYKNLQIKTPRPNLLQNNVVNSEYVHGVANAKNCYLVFDTENSEDSQYCGYINDSKNCYHCYGAIESDSCYNVTLSERLYKCFFVEYSRDCMESSFLFDCRNCSDCFMCTNLRHKKYCFENKQLSKEEYFKKMKGVNLGSQTEIKKLKQEFKKLSRGAIHRAHHNENSINCTGDYNVNSKNCTDCFYVSDSDNLKYTTGADQSRDCMDVDVCLNSELVYDSLVWDFNLYNVKFAVKSYNLRDSEYCELCQNCSNCFGCISLTNKEFCIFNKQYSEAEYYKKLDKIKSRMFSDGEYGEFFTPKLSTVAYDISIVMSFSGFNDIENAKKYGYKTEKISESIKKTRVEEICVDIIPSEMKDVKDGIIKSIIIDGNGKKFGYTKKELEFHRKYNLALPTEHYTTILSRKRMSLGPINFDRKYRKCIKCDQETQVTFPENHPDAPLNIYCEKCYNKEVN